jgi:hypothetical protein
MLGEDRVIANLRKSDSLLLVLAEDLPEEVLDLVGAVYHQFFVCFSHCLTVAELLNLLEEITVFDVDWPRRFDL